VRDDPEHRLSARRPLPGAERDGERWTLRWRGPALMGVVNVTPDSFSDGGRLAGPEAARAAAEAMVAAGARIVDVGAESTRPGATPVDPQEERRRLLPVVEALAEAGTVVVSVDTRRPEVAREALAAGAHLVNDVGGLRDPAMRSVCAEAGAPAVAMHMRGEPATMQDDPRYDDVVAEVDAFLRARAEAAEADGVPSVIVDPGWGFGKRDRHNLALLHGLPRLAAAGRPVLLGASRKGTLGRWTGEPDPARRDPASLAVHLEAARLGAALLRVHDVAGHAQALAVRRALGPRERVPSGDRIVLEGMSFHGYHGVFEEEARIGAPFVVDVELRLPLSGEDRLARTLDYARVYALVAEHVTGRRFRLIEALAAAIAERALALDARVLEVVVRVHKPHAPLPGVVRDVVAEVVRRR
jgi:dihydropteroate synthase